MGSGTYLHTYINGLITHLILVPPLGVYTQ